jgi:GGDEF domain-containing protein
VRVATHSNPLTLLPGNVPILDLMNRLLAQHRRFVVCYADLDNFKPFNDCYGYVKGDEVLLHTARRLESAVARQTDFVGHIGGDDFIVILRSTDWMQRLERLFHEFEASIRLFYSPEHRAAGGMEATDREGRRRWFGFLSLSIALFDTDEITVASVDNISERLQAIKQLAKKVRGNCALMQRSDGFVDLLRSGEGAVIEGMPGVSRSLLSCNSASMRTNHYLTANIS